MTALGRTEHTMGVKVKRKMANVVKEEEADQELGSEGSVEDIGAAPSTWVHEVVPSSVLSKALAVPWLPGALGKEPRALDAPLAPDPLNARHLAVYFPAHSAGCHPAFEAPWHLGVGGVPGGGWVAVDSWQLGGRTAYNARVLGGVRAQAHENLRRALGLGGI